MDRTRARSKIVLAGAALATSALVGAAPAAPAAAAPCPRTVLVTDPGDSGGAHQLRQALVQVCSGGTVRIRPVSIVMAGQAMTIGGAVTVVGVGPRPDPPRGVTINNAINGIFVVNPGAELALEAVTLKGNSKPGSAISVGAGATLTLDDVTITGFHSLSGGGGISSAGGVVMLEGRTTIAQNGAVDGGGGIDSTGGSVTLNDHATVTGNSASGGATPAGGGIRNAGGSIKLNDHAAVTGNTAMFGGGILNGLGASTTAIHDSARVAGNAATIFGGGIYNFGSVSVDGNATLAGNTAVDGGGIANNGGAVTVRDSATMTGNTAYAGGGLGGGIWSPSGGAVTLDDSSSVTHNSGGYGGGITLGPVTLVAPAAAVSTNVYSAAASTATGGSVTVNDCAVVANNAATYYGGGIYVGTAAVTTLNDSSVVTDNSAAYGGGVAIFGGSLSGPKHVFDNTAVSGIGSDIFPQPPGGSSPSGTERSLTQGGRCEHGERHPTPKVTWKAVPPPSPAATDNRLNGVSCVSERFCVAVGGSYQGGAPLEPLVEVWDGTAWSIGSLPSGLPGDHSYLGAVSCVSTRWCVAVGYYGGATTAGHDQPFAERWNGTSWSIAIPPPTASTDSDLLTGVSCVSDRFCMAVGYGPPGTVIETWDGYAWSLAALPSTPGELLTSVSCTSVRLCVAAGFGGDVTAAAEQPFVEAWDGHSWSFTTPPSAGPGFNNRLWGVSCVMTQFCVGAGAYRSPATNNMTAQIETWDGHTWSWTTPPATNPASNNSGLSSVSCGSVRFCVAAGNYWGVTTANYNQPQVELWDGHAWSLTLLPSTGAADNDTLTGVSCVSDTFCVAVGDYHGASTGLDPTVPQPFAEILSAAAVPVHLPGA